MKDQDIEKRTEEPLVIELRTFSPEDEPAESVDGEEILARNIQEELDRIETEAFWAGRNHAIRRSGRIAA